MNFAKLPPAPGGALAERRTADRLLACNDVTMSYGLALTEQQALALAQTRTDALRETRRIERGDGIVGALIETFCTSPYILPENYEETLHELIGLFYTLKNDTHDRVSDGDLLAFLKTAFDGSCRGSLAEALRRLDDAMRLPPLSLEYASLCLPKLAFAVRNAAALGTLDKVFLIPVCE